MQLTTMQDIAGIRAIVSSMDDVNILVSKYLDNKSFRHEFVQQYDYILNPRDSDGYRSHHLVYKYRNKNRPSYNGLRIEIQIRTKLQHIWATAVETMGTILGQALKSQKGTKDWMDFFAIVSSAFSFLEGTNPIPRFAHLSKSQTIDLVSSMQDRLGAIEKMKKLATVIESEGASKSYTYHLLILDSLKQSIRVITYDRDKFENALEEYAKYEKLAAQGEQIEPVLVSAGPMENLKKAYPNLFLDISDFETALIELIGK
jgi:hypothetical protein